MRRTFRMGVGFGFESMFSRVNEIDRELDWEGFQAEPSGDGGERSCTVRGSKAEERTLLAWSWPPWCPVDSETEHESEGWGVMTRLCKLNGICELTFTIHQENRM
jgi:hypothetical protein